MAYESCQYAARWPELWASLPSDQARRSLSAALHNGRLEGMEPDREMVEDLVARSRGEMTGEDYRARAVARARAETAARNAPRS